MLRQYDNPFHMRNQYLEFEPEDADALHLLTQQTVRPLQAMIASTDTVKAEILRSMGFRFRRRCYEMEVSASAYVGETAFGQLRCAERGDEAYARCVERLYGHYCETHQGINPWTADIEAFAAQLPELVWHDNRNNLAFVEDEEIAYVCGGADFELFLFCLLTKLFSEYAMLRFEADDCDQYAMRLRAMFDAQEENGCDTYVYEVQ